MQNNVKSYRLRRQHCPNPHGQPPKWLNVWLIQSWIKSPVSTSCSCIVAVAQRSEGLEWAECSFEAGHWMWMMTEQYFWIDGEKAWRVSVLTSLCIDQTHWESFCTSLLSPPVQFFSFLDCSFSHNVTLLYPASITPKHTHTFFSFMVYFWYAFVITFIGAVNNSVNKQVLTN